MRFLAEGVAAVCLVWDGGELASDAGDPVIHVAFFRRKPR